jgi:hypothetical protein
LRIDDEDVNVERILKFVQDFGIDEILKLRGISVEVLKTLKSH